MSVLATDKKLISFGTDYSAGSGISIIDHTISIVPSAVGKTYSAGDNISIYQQDDDYYISGKDWSNEIADSSAVAVAQSNSFFTNWVNGQYAGDITNITNNLTALSGDLSSYYKKTETSSKEQISDAIQYVSSHAVGDVEVNNYVHNNSATIDAVNSAYKANSASYITAHQSLEGYATESWVTAQGYITGVNIPESATWNEASNVVSSNSASWSEGKTYEGVSPIVVNNVEDKISADTWTLSQGDGVSFVEDSANKLTVINCTATGDANVNSFVTNNSAEIIDVNSSYKANSGKFLTAAPANMATKGDVDELEQTISETYYPNTNPSSFVNEDWVTSQGYITGIDLSNYYTKDETSGAEQLAQAFAAIPSDVATTGDISNLEQTISNTYYPKSNPSSFVSEDWVTHNENVVVLNAGSSTLSSLSAAISANKEIVLNLYGRMYRYDSLLTQFGNQALFHKIDTSNDTYAGRTKQLNEFENVVVGIGNLTGVLSSNYTLNTISLIADWNESNSNLPSYIKNKPDLSNSAIWNEVSAKLDTSAFSSVSGDFLTTSFSIPESATWNETSNVLQSHSAQWGQGGSGGSVSSKYGTISVDGSNIEATNKAIEFNSNGFTSSFDNKIVNNIEPLVLTWDSYSQDTSIHVDALNTNSESGTLTYSSNTNVTGEVTTGAYNSLNFDVPIPNATAIQFTTDKSFQLHGGTRVTAPTSFKVSELSWKSDLPTYEYNSNRKLSAINGSALVGNEDYLVEQGFVQNLTSPKGTIKVLNNNKIEGTNSAIASDVIEGFVSAYNGLSVYPGNSTTLSWANYVPNTILHVSGKQYTPNTLTYSADTGVTGQISLPNEGETSIEVPTNSTSIVIGNENWSTTIYNFTVSADNYYQIGELAWASAIPTYEYDSTNKISAINGSALAGGSDVPVSANEAIQYVQTNSAVIDATITNVTSNSSVWGGSALPISAGPGIGLNLDNNVLIISSNGAGGGLYSTSALLYQGSKNDQRTTAWNLTESISSYKMIQCDWIDTNNYYISKQIPIPSGLGSDMTRAAFFDAVFEYGTDLWCKAQRFSAQNTNVYAQVDEYCVHTNGTVSNVGSDVSNNRPIMVQIIGVK